jgi:DNA-binding XRE family transcriptional regulator
MPCRCGEEKRSDRAHTFRRTVAGCTFTAEVIVDSCAGCGGPNVPAALVLAFERALAIELARRGPISGETFRWIRKAAALERTDLAQLLGVTVETIASWEEERRPTDIAAWTVVASIALDASEGPRPLRTRIRTRRCRRDAAPPINTSLAIDTRAAGSIAKVLALLASSIAMKDTDIADALDVDCGSVRARLRELAALGLIASLESPGSDAVCWVLASRDWSVLIDAAARAGVDVDAPLPRAKRSADAKVNAHRTRPPNATSRAV